MSGSSKSLSRSVLLLSLSHLNFFNSSVILSTPSISLLSCICVLVDLCLCNYIFGNSNLFRISIFEFRIYLLSLSVPQSLSRLVSPSLSRLVSPSLSPSVSQSLSLLVSQSLSLLSCICVLVDLCLCNYIFGNSNLFRISIFEFRIYLLSLSIPQSLSLSVAQSLRPSVA